MLFGTQSARSVFIKLLNLRRNFKDTSLLEGFMRSTTLLQSQLSRSSDVCKTSHIPSSL